MNNEEMMMIAKLFNEHPCNSYEVTKSHAEIDGDDVVIRNVNSDCKTFNHVEVVAAIAAAFRGHLYADVENGQVIMRIF